MDSIVEGIGSNRLTQNFERARRLASSKYDSDASGNANIFDDDVAESPQAFETIDLGIQVSDQEVIHMSRYLLQHEGLFLGSSSAVHLAACIKLARELIKGLSPADPPSQVPLPSPKEITLITMLCDSGTRHLNKLWNDGELASRGFVIPPTNTPWLDLSFIQ